MKDDKVQSGTGGEEALNPFEIRPIPRIPDHELLHRIGEGSYGEVWLARNIMGTFRAIKVVYRQKFEEDRPFDREFNGLKRFEPISRSHDGFVDILQIGHNQQDGYFYSVMELADSRDGSNEIDPTSYEPKTISAIVVTREPLPYDQCLEFGLAASAALAFLHKRGLVHRDIKPSNLIVVHGVLKLADVGMVTEVGSASIAGGTIGYIAPEGTPSPQADVYSLGKVLYELSTGLDRLKHPSLPDFWSTAPDLQALSELNEVILKACEPNPALRYASAEDLHRELVLLQAGQSVKRLRWLEHMVALFRKATLIVIAIACLASYEFLRIYQQRERESKRVADVHAATGANLASEGDFLGSLPWYAEALESDRRRPDRAIRHRINMETAIRYSPRIVRMFFESDDVSDVAFSPDGRELAEALANGHVVVRNIQTGNTNYILLGHSNKVQSVAWSGDGKHLLSAGVDGTARVWSTETRQMVANLSHSGAVFSAAFNSRDDLVVTASAVKSTNQSGGLVRVWRWDRSEILRERLVHREPSRSAAFSGDDQWIVSGGEDGFAFVLESKSLDSSSHFRHPDKAGLPTWIYDTRFSPDGKLVATAAFDHLVRVFAPTNFQSPVFFHHDAPVHSVQFSPDQQFLLTACDDYTARIWDLTRTVEAFPPLRHNSFVLKATFSPDSRLVATATTGGIVTIWDLAPLQWKPLGPVIYNPDGRAFARIETNAVRLFNADTEAVLGAPITSTGKIRDLRFTHDGRRLLVVSEVGNAPTGGHLVAQLYGADGSHLGNQFSLTNFIPEAPSHFIAGMSSNGQRVAVVLGRVVELWDAQHGRMIGDPVHHLEYANATISPDGSRLLTYSTNQVYLINGLTGEQITALKHTANVDHAEFSPNNLLLATACRDNEEKARAAYVWDARDGRSLGRTLQHQDGVSQVAFSSDSKYLLTVGEDRIVKQWRVGSWELERWFPHSQGFVSAYFNADNSRVVTAASDDTLRVWDAKSKERVGIPLTPPLKHPYNLWHARFIGNGDRVLAKRLVLDRWTRTFEEVANTEEWRQYFEAQLPQDWEKSIWNLEVKIEDVDLLQAMAELLSAQRIEMDRATPLSIAELEGRWLKVSHSSLAAFDFAPDEISAWHQQQAEIATQQQNAFAALFHLNRLVPLTPSDTRLREQINRLRSVLKGTQSVTPATAK